MKMTLRIDDALLRRVMTATRDLAVCGVVRCEVGRGLRNRTVSERFDGHFSRFPGLRVIDRLE